MKEERHKSLFDLYTLGDVFAIWRRSKKKIIKATVVCGLLGALWALTEPIRYTSESTFREKSQVRGGIGGANSIAAMLISSNGEKNDSSAISTMKSRTLAEQLLQKSDMQAIVIPDDRVDSYFSRIVKNLKIEYSRFMNKRIPAIPYKPNDIKATQIVYKGTIPIGLKLVFNTPSDYTVYMNDEEIARGAIGKRLEHPQFAFQINQNTQADLTDKKFSLILLPLAYAAEDLSKQISITTDKDDNSLLRIRYRCGDLQESVNCLNTLMSVYQKYLDIEHRRMINKQIGYLERRQNEINDKLYQMMHAHAQTLSNDFSTIGFIDTQRAMEFLATHQHAIKSKQLQFDAEIKRLTHALEEGKTYVDSSLNNGNEAQFINSILLEIRELRQQQDSIQVSLSSNPGTVFDPETTFNKQISKLADLETAYQDTTGLIAELDNGKLPDTLPSSLQSSDYLASTWHAKIVSEKDDDGIARFKNYLKQLQHQLKVYAKTVEENLSHQHQPVPELQGMNLKIAQELFLNYSKEASLTESQIHQHTFVIDQLQNPEFEISSLSTVLNDPVSRDIIALAARTKMDRNDQSNRSEKELKRLQDDLLLQRQFLQMHVKNTKELLELRYKLLQDKIQALQHATLSLIQQNIGVAENQIAHHIKMRRDNLFEEIALLDRQQLDLQKQMAKLPDKWVSEQLIHQQMEMQRQMGKELTNLVESKNISSNLEIIQSAPVDSAIAPIHPDSPRLMLFTIFGAFFGGFCMIAWSLIQALGHGILASKDNLRLAGQTAVDDVDHLCSLLENSTEPRKALLIAPSEELTDTFKQRFSERNANVHFTKLNAPLKRQELIKALHDIPLNHNDWHILSVALSGTDPAIMQLLDECPQTIIYVQNEPLSSFEPILEKIQQTTKPVYWYVPVY